MPSDDKALPGPDRPGRSLAHHLIELTAALPTAQTLLDRQYEADLAAFAAAARQAGMDPADPLLPSLAPPRLVLSTLEVKANFLFSRERSTRVGVDLRLNGRLVNSFSERQFGDSESVRDRLSITVETSPVSDPSPSSENNHA